MSYTHGGRSRSSRSDRPHHNHTNQSSRGSQRSSRGNNYATSASGRNFKANAFKSTAIQKQRYINQPVESVSEEVYQAIHRFDSFGLDPLLIENVKQRGYTTPTPIQDQAIPPLLAGRDVVGLANTGTGKTAAFLLPLIHKVIQDQTQGVMIIAPTRELALQICDEFRAFTKNLPVSVCAAIGGASLTLQMSAISQNPHFIIGTPGRLKDLLDRRVIDVQMFKTIVLDEVDRMLDIGFRRDIQYLIAHLPQERHAAFFSATLNREAETIMHTLLRDPVRIAVKKQETSSQVHQDVVTIKPGQSKVEVLHQLLLQAEFERVIVFGRTKHGINKLERMLSERGLRVRAIHGNKSQAARQRSLQDFKRGRVQALLATDIASRGIDVDNVTHVINYDEPQSYEDYIHRIGRTGRAGKVGKALTFVL